MNLLKAKIKIKMGKKVFIKKLDSKLIVENKSDSVAIIVFPKIFFEKQGYNNIIKFSGVTECGQEPELKIINRKRNIIFSGYLNSEYYNEKIAKLFFVAIKIYPFSKTVFSDISIKKEQSTLVQIEKKFKGDTLLICPGYPSYNNKYEFGFVHTKVEMYKKLNWDIDVVVTKDINYSRSYIFENIKVFEMNYSNLRNLLQEKKYKKIIIHYFKDEYAQILDATDLSETKIYIYSHGGDTIYRDINIMNTPYFNQAEAITFEQEKSFRKKDLILNRYNEKDNVKWIFGTKWAKERSEHLNNIIYRNTEIIPCYINETIFDFNQKSADLRKKILILRKYDNINTYGIDINVRVILELSKRPFFKNLEFNIYGDGYYHDILLKPLRKFDNVHIYKKFLTHKEISEIHKEHGVALFATRYETQGVSAAEAAMSGLVVLSSNVCAVPEVFDIKLGTLFDNNDYVKFADKIEELYYDENKFLLLNKKMHANVKKTCGYDVSVKKEIEMYEKDDKKSNELYKYKEPNQNIILTVAIPSYNVEKYIKNGVFSLINHEISNKIEVLIINDGSKDSTSKIGKELEKLTTINNKSIVKLIDKKNGGHGSTINKGIEVARGKYFKLMDGDDYFDTENFVKLIKKLEKEDTDIILNNYVEDFSITCTTNVVKHYEFMEPNKLYFIDDLCYEGYGFKKWGPLLSTSTYKTQMLREGKFKISENCFYVDMELNFFSFIEAKTIKYFPLDIYMYYLGRPGQSISAESYKKNYKHHETVTLKIIKEFYKNNNLSDNKKTYIMNKIILPLVEAQYYITTEYLSVRKPFIFFDSEIRKYLEIYNNPFIATKRVNLHRKTRGLFINTMRRLIKLKTVTKSILNRY